MPGSIMFENELLLLANISSKWIVDTIATWLSVRLLFRCQNVDSQGITCPAPLLLLLLVLCTIETKETTRHAV
jgi:hypothetical protein